MKIIHYLTVWALTLVGILTLAGCANDDDATVTSTTTTETQTTTVPAATTSETRTVRTY